MSFSSDKSQDHEWTKEHSPVAGMADRIYWFDHSQYEEAATSSQFNNSPVNMFEVNMIVELVKYLVAQNVYRLGDIAVLVSISPAILLLSSVADLPCARHLTLGNLVPSPLI